VKLLNFKHGFKTVHRCPCGRTHNPPGMVWEATLEEVQRWVRERGYDMQRCGPDVPCGDESVSMIEDWPK